VCDGIFVPFVYNNTTIGCKTWILTVIVTFSGHTAADLSLNDLKVHRGTDHRGRHHHSTQIAEDTLSELTTTASDVEELGENVENFCCRRREKFVSIGFGK
jgi:hypothetical protein